MNELAYEFHENMVIWKKAEVWNGVGFFGESRHGKTPLSFAIARLLFLGGIAEIKIFDDCFTIEDGRIRQCKIWGTPDHLGQVYYADLTDTMKGAGRSVKEVEPGRVSYPLGKIAMYLLFFADITTQVEKKRCHRQEFVDKLMSTNPFAWSYPKPGKDVVLKRFKDNWSYFIIRRQKETTRELIDRLASEAIADSKFAE